MTRQDQIKGLLWGCALGDSLGMPYEFTYGRYPFQKQIQPNGNLPVGQVSDDTEMMMAGLQTIYKNKGKWDRNKMIDAYCKWASSGVWDIGLTTRMLFLHINNVDNKHIKAYEASFHEIYTKQEQSRWSQSNGCLMRCMSIILCDKNEQRWIDDAALSNPHPVCLEASNIYFRMLNNILENKHDPLSVDWSSQTQIQECIQDALSVKTFDKPGKRNVSRSRGWVLHGLYFAMIMYHNKFDTIEDGAEFVIGQHLDSDTDTNGAIALSLLGCKLGYQNMIQNSLTKTNIDLIRDASVQRPTFYHPKYIDEICETIL
jgi:ADP-ribosylglycohydrolase